MGDGFMGLPLPEIMAFPRRPEEQGVSPKPVVSLPPRTSISNISVYKLSLNEDFEYQVYSDGAIIYSPDDDLYFNKKNTLNTSNNFILPQGTIFTIYPADDSRILHFRPVSTDGARLIVMEVNLKQ